MTPAALIVGLLLFGALVVFFVTLHVVPGVRLLRHSGLRDADAGGQRMPLSQRLHVAVRVGQALGLAVVFAFPLALLVLPSPVPGWFVTGFGYLLIALAVVVVAIWGAAVVIGRREVREVNLWRVAVGMDARRVFLPPAAIGAIGVVVTIVVLLLVVAGGSYGVDYLVENGVVGVTTSGLRDIANVLLGAGVVVLALGVAVTGWRVWLQKRRIDGQGI